VKSEGGTRKEGEQTKVYQTDALERRVTCMKGRSPALEF
jgi:hypothetical protein